MKSRALTEQELSKIIHYNIPHCRVDEADHVAELITIYILNLQKKEDRHS